MRFHFSKVLFAAVITLAQAVCAIHAQSVFAEGGEPNGTTPAPVVRWTGEGDGGDPDASLTHILSVLSLKTGKPSLSPQDFILQEDRDLAFNHYQRWVQVIDQVPVHGNFIRIWTQLNSGRAIQVEANVAETIPPSGPADLSRSSGRSDNTGFLPSNPVQQTATSRLRQRLSSEETIQLARDTIDKYQDDPYLRGVDWKDEWHKNKLIRLVKVKGKRGYHQIRISLKSKKVISHQYREFPQGDFSIPVQVYPIYEEVENAKGSLLPRVPTELKHVLTEVPLVSGDIYSQLKEAGKTHPYLISMVDPVLGETAAGRASGFWSMNYIKEQASLLRDQLPVVPNDWQHGVLLEGKYATINIHPDAIATFKSVDFTLEHSSPLFINWTDSTYDGKPNQIMSPDTAYAGQRLHSPEEAWNRRAQRLSNHDPVQYMNDGFDEIQVYYAIDKLFEALQARGFKDPELSTRPFNAFLFNPDIAYRDNAFYTDDTINFTTYSPKAANAARDNSTIWHELGHGVMDRLMGSNIELADTGGLSEGMADFVAAMVIQAVTDGVSFPGSDKFRIINRTGFYLTNEVHDDGEAYGGAMKDFMDAVIQSKGPMVGLNQIADVVLEAMRLTRDYPGLTAPEWFKHILFADSLGRPGLRLPGELSPFLLKSLAGRNFNLKGESVASFSLVNLTSPNSGGEIVAGSPGARENPIRLALGKNQTANFQLQASLKSSSEFKFRYPAEIRVQYHGSPLQGAIHWVGKENGSQSYFLQSESDRVTLPLQVTGTCDEVNRTDGSCVDYADVLVFDSGSDRPMGKKRFYLRVKTTGET